MAEQELQPCGDSAMSRLTFTDDDLSAIAFERYYHPEPFVQRKFEVLWLKSQGLAHHDIARLAGVSRASVQRYLREFLTGGLDAIRRYPWRGQPSAPGGHRASPQNHLRPHPPAVGRGGPAGARTAARVAPRRDAGPPFPPPLGAAAAPGGRRPDPAEVHGRGPRPRPAPVLGRRTGAGAGRGARGPPGRVLRR